MGRAPSENVCGADAEDPSPGALVDLLDFFTIVKIITRTKVMERNFVLTIVYPLKLLMPVPTFKIVWIRYKRVAAGHFSLVARGKRHFRVQ